MSTTTTPKIEININSDYPHSRSGEPKRYHDKIYFWVDNETIMENILNRRNRPYKYYKETLIPILLDNLKRTQPKMYEQLKDVKWSWNQKCGCSMCPCSPGFIGDVKRDNKVLDIHITIK